jgi:hypothetical protein
MDQETLTERLEMMQDMLISMYFDEVSWDFLDFDLAELAYEMEPEDAADMILDKIGNECEGSDGLAVCKEDALDLLNWCNM